MKQEIDRRAPTSFLDYIALSVTTFGVGYLPLMPGTFGSAIGVGIYLGAERFVAYIHSSPSQYASSSDDLTAWFHAFFAALFLLFCLIGVWASGRSTSLLGNTDPPQAVVDEVIGQLIVFLFVPFGAGWSFVVTGFLLFRLFDIWKPYPIDSLQVLPGGIGVCADDILAGVYAGVCLSILYAISLSI